MNPANRNGVVVIDNYDSFAYNLVQHLGRLNCEVSVLSPIHQTRELAGKESNVSVPCLPAGRLRLQKTQPQDDGSLFLVSVPSSVTVGCFFPWHDLTETLTQKASS